MDSSSGNCPGIEQARGLLDKIVDIKYSLKHTHTSS